MTEIRGMLSDDKELGELKRDLQGALGKIPPFEIKTLDTTYTEPMYLGVQSKPKGVLLLSAIDASDQEDASTVLGGTACHITWDGVRSRVRINSIDGYTPDPTVLFRFTFLVVG